MRSGCGDQVAGIVFWWPSCPNGERERVLPSNARRGLSLESNALRGIQCVADGPHANEVGDESSCPATGQNERRSHEVAAGCKTVRRVLEQRGGGAAERKGSEGVNATDGSDGESSADESEKRECGDLTGVQWKTNHGVSA